MPDYFADYDTTVEFITAEEMQKNHSGLAHGGFVIHSGSTGPEDENTNIIEYRLKLDSNPEFTGSVLTAVAALEQGKDVFAVPGRFGDMLSEGCNALIGQGAGIIYDLDVFLQNLGYLPEKKTNLTKIKNISLAKTEQLNRLCHEKS